MTLSVPPPPPDSSSALARLLRPRSVAVVGGGAWCEAVLEQCHRMRFAGTVHAVHPHRKAVSGVTACPDVAALPEAPDAAFVGVNRVASVEIVRALAARGAGGAVCFANGFAESGEADGIARQRALLEAAGSLALLGPNCYGFVNALDGAALWPDQHGLAPLERGVAVVTQSSNVALNLSMQRRGLPLAYLVTSGNQAQRGFAAIGRALLEDARVTALGLHVEGFGDVRAFEALAAFAVRLGKPVVVLKAGRSPAARYATLSHTASLAGSETGAGALLARLGIPRVASLPVLVETLKLAHVHGAAPLGRTGANGGRIVHLASLSCSGGEAALVADAAHAGEVGADEGRSSVRSTPRLAFPPPHDARRRALADVLGPRVAIANPLDYDTGIWRDAAALETVYAAACGDDIDLTLLVLDVPRDDLCDAGDWARPLDALERAARSTGERFALVASLPENLPEPLARRLLDAGITPLAGIDDALAAVRALASFDDRATENDYRPTLLAGNVVDDSSLPDAGATDTVLSEARAKRWLAGHGLAIPRGASATGAREAATVATSLGFPVALKGEGFAHKSEAGAVVLGLANARAVEHAARAMPCDRFLIEAMASDGVAELLVGVVHDPAHGFVLTLGAGGILTDVLADRASALLPVTAEQVESLLDRLRIGRVIAGVRGRAGADRASIVRAVLAVQEAVRARAGHLVELEINPLLCRVDGAIALDALVVLRVGGDEPDVTRAEP